ncbi:DNA polymerase III subunit delta [Domibacillus epiphyticus]|uniref:DNA polymerase III subunit delta n=1 Tax=Domibacillus epiphyticus TaxID=1714355 RepID=A0A1V2A9F8_9BACI|nr:DNA polymerase III subunit delta [Domibacillus epiphyticus]OMP67623.1 DNA polymerase III subunit delta [Domibacillus epiphyticus]
MDVLKELKNGRFRSLYLLYGPEQYFIEEARNLLIKNVLDGDAADLNVTSFDMTEVPIDAAIEEAETLPFLGERKLVFVQNPLFFTAEKSKIDHDLKKLEQYLQDPSPYSILVFLARFEKMDERKKITKLIKKQAGVLEAKRPAERELSGWIKSKAAEEGASIEEAAIHQLLNIAGFNLSVLAMEIAKLAVHAGVGGEITEEDVTKLTARTLESDIFRLVDQIVTGKWQAAFRIYYDLIRLNEEPLKILAVIAGQFRLIYQVKELSKKGYGQQQIAGQLKVHPFRVKIASGQSLSFSENQLSSIVQLLAESDYEMKSSGMEKKMIIEMFFFRLQTMMKLK